LSALRSDGSWVVRRGRLDRMSSGQKTLKESPKLKGYYQARVHSSQMVLVVVSRVAGPGEQWPKTLKEKSEKNTLGS
jgi:hypothetical protein